MNSVFYIIGVIVVVVVILKLVGGAVDLDLNVDGSGTVGSRQGRFEDLQGLEFFSKE